MRRSPVVLPWVVCLALVWLGPGRALGETPGRSAKRQPPALELVVEELAPEEGREARLRLEETPLADAEARTLLDRIVRVAPALGDAGVAPVAAGALAPSPGTPDFSLVGENSPRPAAHATASHLRTALAEAEADPGVGSVSPEGEAPVDAAPTIRFATEMVPLGTPDAPVTPYATLEPAVPGTWRWIGTRTLLFEPAGRLPAATAFRVRIPSGLRDAATRPLLAGRVFTFSTPRPTPTHRYPEDEKVTGRQPIVALRFDQPVSSVAARFVRLEVAGRPVALRPVSPEELRDGGLSAYWLREAPPGTLLALRPEAPLPPGTRATVTVAAGLPSAEGPLPSVVDHTFSFEVPPPFRVQGLACDGQEGTTPDGLVRCPASGTWAVVLSGPAGSPGRGQIRLEPPVPGIEFQAVDDEVWFRGAFHPGRYRVVVSRGLRSEAGEPLGRDRVLEVEALPAAPWVSGPTESDLVIPRATASLSVRSRNFDRLRVALRRVRLEDRPRFQECSRSRRATSTKSAAVWRIWELGWFSRASRVVEGPTSPTCELPGEPVEPLEVPVQHRPGTAAETGIPLAAALPGGTGQIVATVEGESEPLWIQVTDLGVEAWRDATHAYVWVTSLETARPIAGAEVWIGGRSRGTTDAEGFLRLPLPGVEASELEVRHGSDTALVRLRLVAGWRDAYRWYALLDRDVVRPGETLHARVLLRRIERTAEGDLTTAGLPSEIRWRLDGRELAVEGLAIADAPGGFTIEATLPEGVRLGPADLMVSVPAPDGARRNDWKTVGTFRIEAYRRPEFELELERSELRVAAGDPVTLAAGVRYHAGSPLAGADVSWSLRSEESLDWLPARDGFFFGTHGGDRLFARPDRYGREPRSDDARRLGTTDRGGRHALAARLSGLAPDEVLRVVAEATVTDGNGRTWSSRTRVQVHPAAVAVGVRTGPSFDRPGQLDVQAMVVGLDGRAVEGRPVRLAVERLEKVAGRKEPRIHPVGECRRTSGEVPILCSFPSTGRGTLRVVALTEDEQGRQHRTVLRPDAWEGDQVAGRFELIPDRASYEPGETAHLRIAAPFAPAEGLVTLVRGNVIGTQRITLASPRAEVAVPVGAGPELRVEVLLVAPMEAGVPRRALASIDLPVSTRDRRLAVSVRPRETELLPGGETLLFLEARDARDRPAAGATFTVVAVDEAVLALTGFRHPDPARSFSDPWPTASDRVSIRQELPALPDAEAGVELSKPEGSYLLQRVLEPISARAWFDPLALFAGAVTADAEGRATVRLRVPDSLTRYRIVAVAADERRAGIGESSLSTRQPLELRPSPPRFARPGDRIDLPVIVANGGDREVETAVALRVHGARLEGPAGRRVVLAAGSRALVRFPLIAGGPGTIAVALAAAGDDAADAVELSIPVRPPTIRETAAAYGTLAAEPRPASAEGRRAGPPGTTVELRRPPEALAGQGALEVSAGGGGLAELVEAARWLAAYPLDCAEQSSARLLGLLALRKYGLLLPGEIETPEALRARIDAEVQRLLALEDDGSFRLWPGMAPETYESWFSTQAAHALVAAENAGVDFAWRRSAVLRALDPRWRRDLGQLDRDTAAETMRARAYELWVRSQAGNGRPSERRGAAREMAAHDELPAEATALLLAALGADPGAEVEVASLVTRLEACLREDPGSAHVLPDRHGSGAFGSQVRADALALIGLDATRPGHPLAEKLARGLLAARDDAGRWRTTQENAFALLALAPRLARVPETPGVLQAWLGERYLGTARRDRPLSLPLDLVPTDPAALVLVAPGGGSLPYRAVLRWAVDEAAASPRERGFALSRSYEAIDDPEDVRRDEDGTLRIRAGARVRVRLAGWTPVARRQVAVVDPLPAGFEPLTPGLQGEKRDREGASTWGLDHVELGDDRAFAFASQLWPGPWSWSWTATAPTPGIFVAPPATVEAMYEPEVMARTPALRIVVVAR